MSALRRLRGTVNSTASGTAAVEAVKASGGLVADDCCRSQAENAEHELALDRSRRSRQPVDARCHRMQPAVVDQGAELLAGDVEGSELLAA